LNSKTEIENLHLAREVNAAKAGGSESHREKERVGVRPDCSGNLEERKGRSQRRPKRRGISDGFEGDRSRSASPQGKRKIVGEKTTLIGGGV